MARSFVVLFAVLTVVSAHAGVISGGMRSLDEFPVLSGETDDTARFQRAVNASTLEVLYVPAGLYRISAPIVVTNDCSIEMHKTAVLRAESAMPYVLRVTHPGVPLPAGDYRRDDHNLFVVGGKIDGNGLASCMYLDGFPHFTMRDTTFLNGRECGLHVQGGYELIAQNLYFKCVLPGLAGNTALYTCGGDSHYTDCVSVDYTVGFRVVQGGSNRFTRCHVWGGVVPPAAPGEFPEMLKDSVSFWVDRAGSTIFRDCYADTSQTGFLVNGWDTRLLGCSYYNNASFGLTGITIIRHPFGRLLVSDGGFDKNTPDTRVYEGVGTVTWSNMVYSGFGAEDYCPGAMLVNGKEVDGRVGTIQRLAFDEKGGFLRVAKGGSHYLDLDRSVAIADEKLTVEFFVRGGPDGVSAWSTLLTVGGSWNNYATAGIVVASNQSKNLQLKVGTADGFLVADTSADLTDGLWHHVAVTVKPINAGAGSHVSGYVDYERVLDRDSAPYRYATANCLDVNRTGGSPNAATSVDVDEVRLTRGVLASEDFLRLEPKAGLSVFIQ